MGAFEIRNDRFAILADVVYAKIGASKSGKIVCILARISAPGIGGSVTVKAEMAIAELAAAYEIAHWAAACRAPAPRSMFSAAAGSGGKRRRPISP